MSQELPEVRIAVRADEDDLMAMCNRLWQENGLFSYEAEKVRGCLHRCFNGAGTIVGVIGPVGKIEASTCLSISDYYYTNAWHLAELWNFVDEPYRRSHNAEALITFGKECSEKMNIPFLTGIITNKHMAGKVRLYRRMLGAPTGAFFVHNASWKAEPMEDHRELRNRLRDFARKCTDGKISTGVARKELGPLLREASDAIRAEDELWGIPKAGPVSFHTNGTG